ncbi:MAG: hypothetical protein WAX04_02975 [Oscillospiraceae bacterium]
MKPISYECSKFLLYKCDHTLSQQFSGQDVIYRCKRSGYMEGQLYVTSEVFIAKTTTYKLSDKSIYLFLCKYYGVKKLECEMTCDIKLCDILMAKQFGVKEFTPILSVQQRYFAQGGLVSIVNTYVNTGIQKYTFENSTIG